METGNVSGFVGLKELQNPSVKGFYLGPLRLYPWVWGPFRDHFRKLIGNMGAILVVYWENPLGLRP